MAGQDSEPERRGAREDSAGPDAHVPADAAVTGQAGSTAGAVPQPGAPPALRRGLVAALAAAGLLLACGVMVALVLTGGDDRMQRRTVAEGAQVERIDLGRRTIPGDVAADARSAYVIERQSGDLIRVARASGKITGRLSVGPNATDIAIDQTSGGRLWVANVRRKTVAEIDTRRFRPVGRPFHVQREPDDLAVLDREIVVLSKSSAGSHALRVSKKTHHDVGKPVEFGNGVITFAAGGPGLVVTGGVPAVPVVGTATPTLKGALRSKYTLDQLDGIGRELVVDRNVAWVAVWETRYRNKTKEDPIGDPYEVGTVIRVNLHTGNLIGKKIEVGLTPTDIALDGDVIWVVSRREGTVTRIDKKSGRLIGKPIELGERVIDGSLAVSHGVAWVSGENDLFRVEP